MAFLRSYWALAIIGAIAKMVFWSTNPSVGLFLYLGMGWLSVLGLSRLMWAKPCPLGADVDCAGGF